MLFYFVIYFFFGWACRLSVHAPARPSVRPPMCVCVCVCISIGITKHHLRLVLVLVQTDVDVQKKLASRPAGWAERSAKTDTGEKSAGRAHSWTS